MRKPAFCMCENKDADQLRGNQLCGNCEADQRLCFRYTDTTIPLLSKFKPLAILCGCTARFVSDLVGNPEDRFCHNEAQIIGFIKAPLEICHIFHFKGNHGQRSRSVQGTYPCQYKCSMLEKEKYLSTWQKM